MDDLFHLKLTCAREQLRSILAQLAFSSKPTDSLRCLNFAARGVSVVISGRREDVGTAAVKGIEAVATAGAKVRFIRNDVTSEQAVDYPYRL